VEANEVMLRIVWRHRWLLVILVVLPIAVVLPMRLAQSVSYSATADVQTQAAAPSASTQVSSILSQVSATATNPAVVQKAIDASKVDRSAINVAKHQISTSSLDSSGIVAVTVKDRDRQVATQLSQALASAVVNALNAPGTASNQQLKALTAQEDQLNATRKSLLDQLNSDQAGGLGTTDPKVEAAITELAGVDAQLTANGTAQAQILTDSNANVDASVISEPTFATTTAGSRGVMVDAALAGLLGLIIGLLIATIDELVRPTVADAEAGARELGVVFLGNAETSEGKRGEEEQIALDRDLMTRMRLAADRLGVLTVFLTGPISSEKLTQLAAVANRRLSPADRPVALEPPARTNGGRVEAAGAIGRNGRKTSRSTVVKAPALAVGSALSTLKVHPLSDMNLKDRPEAPTILVALRRFAPRASLDRVADLGETTGWPILGVVGVRQKPGTHGVWRTIRSRAGAPKSEDRETPPPSTSLPPKITTPAQAPYHEVFLPRKADSQGHAQ
jgi:capsular polysaccharide biosynthesis protein